LLAIKRFFEFGERGSIVNGIDDQDKKIVLFEEDLLEIVVVVGD